MTAIHKLSIAAIGAAFVALTGSSASAAVIGGSLFSTGGQVLVEVLPADAGATSELSLYSPNQQSIATNREVGKVVNLGSFAVGVELIFGILVNGNNFLMGSQSRNPDGIAHAAVEFLSPGVAIVGFEDRFDGGDLDFNDNIFRFTGGIAETSTPVPEPTTIFGTLAFGTFAACSRLKRKQQAKSLNSKSLDLKVS